jgi:hypothetical protein
MAAPAYIAAGTKGSGTGSSINVTYPTVSANDFLIIWAMSIGGGTIATPTGFTKIMNGILRTPPFTNVGVGYAFYKIASGSESGTIAVSRSGHSGSNTFIGQMYQYRGTQYIGYESENHSPYGGNGDTITWDAVTVNGTERTLCALIANYDAGNPGSPSGYTNNQSDNTGGEYLECNTKANVSSDGSVTATGGSSQGWLTTHITIYNGAAPSSVGRSFIVN